MSFEHTMLTIGGLVLLSTFVLSLNGSILQNQITMVQSDAMLEALAYAQKYIEEAEACRFDEDPSATIPNSFTLANNLGPDTGEVYPYFDDIDDFNGYTRTDNTSGNVPFTINISVHYVTKEHPDTPTTSRTYFKRMTISISSPALSSLPGNTLQVKRLFAYHYFYTE